MTISMIKSQEYIYLQDGYLFIQDLRAHEFIAIGLLRINITVIYTGSFSVNTDLE
jgi:hypothetical protein